MVGKNKTERRAAHFLSGTVASYWNQRHHERRTCVGVATDANGRGRGDGGVLVLLLLLRGGRRRRGGTAAVSGGRRLRGDPVSERPGRLSAGTGAGRLFVLSVRRVRPGRDVRVQRGRPAVRRPFGMRRDGNYLCINVAPCI